MFDSNPRAIRARRVLSPILVFPILLIIGALPVAAHEPRQYSEWGAATPVAEVNTPSHDGCPIESPNGKRLFIASNRPGSLGSNDIWVAERPNRQAPWGPMENLGAPVNTEFNDFCPTPLGHRWLMFVSERPGADTCAAGAGYGDIYIVRQRRNGTWTDPQHLGCNPHGPNFTGAEFSPSLVHTTRGTFLYFSSNGSDLTGDQDIYVSRLRPNGTYGPARLVEELNTPAADQMPNVSRNGKEIVFASSRDGNMDIWTATWDRSEGGWSAPTKLPATVNTAEPESRPSLSGDGKRLYFGRGVPPGDVFVSTRTILD